MADGRWRTCVLVVSRGPLVCRATTCVAGLGLGVEGYIRVRRKSAHRREFGGTGRDSCVEGPFVLI